MLVPSHLCAPLSDQEIVRKALLEVDYFSCLYERYEARLLRYIRRLAAVDPGEAEDILQEAFIRIWKHLNDYDSRLPLSSWVYRIVHNQAVSHLRKRITYGKDRRVAWDENRFADLEPDDSPQDAELQEKELVLVQKVLRQMPLQYREVLVLKYLENMHYAEISDILKIPEGTVATRINRAKKVFRQIEPTVSINLEA